MSGQALTIHGLCLMLLFGLSALLTRLMIGVNIVDVPNHRSSHDRPTPKSGGIAIAATYFVGILALYLLSDTLHAGRDDLLLHLGLAIVLLGTGLADDMREIPPLVKLSVQGASAVLFAWGVGAFEVLPLPAVGTIALGPLAIPLTALWIVAVMNLVNFMDGINGLVSGVMLIAALALAALAGGADSPYVYLSSLVLVGATAGFFVFNFPAGQIFLGDTGSMFLGYVMATLAVVGTDGGAGSLSPYLVPILLLPLLFDATWTIVVRARRGEKLWVAHRDHLYQQLTRAGLKHAEVSPLYFGLALLCVGGAYLVQQLLPTHGLYVLLGLIPAFVGFTLWGQRFARRRRAARA